MVSVPTYAELVTIEKLGTFVDTTSAEYWQVKYLGGSNTNSQSIENFDWQTARGNSEPYKNVYEISTTLANQVHWNPEIPWISPSANTEDLNGYYSYVASFTDTFSLDTNQSVAFNGLGIDFASDDHLHAILINGEVYQGFASESFDYPGWTQKLTHIWLTDIEQWWNIGGENTIEFIVHNNNSGNNYVNVPNPTGFSADIQAAYLVNTATIPEPETYAMMLAGLGIVGMIARRRKQM